MQIKTLMKNQENHSKYLEFKRFLKEELAKTLVEVEVPVTTPEVIQEKFLSIFETDLEFAGEKTRLFLQPHPELYLKNLLLTGFASLFTIAKSFRNGEDATKLHFPEFEMLEIYIKDMDYLKLADFTLNTIKNIFEKMTGKTEFIFNGQKIDLKKLKKVKIEDAFKKWANVENVMDSKKFMQEAAKLGYKTEGFTDIELFSQIYTDKIESNLGFDCPEIIYDFPPFMSSTSWVENGVTQRWELYFCGIELANGAREGDLNVKKNVDFKKFFNENLVSGLGLGVDRLFMTLFGLEKIEDLKVVSYE